MRRIKRAQQQKGQQNALSEPRIATEQILEAMKVFVQTLQDTTGSTGDNQVIDNAIKFIYDAIGQIEDKLDEMDALETKKRKTKRQDRVLEISMAQMTIGMEIGKLVSSVESLKSSLLTEASKALKENNIEKTV